jgi:SOS-response transcriptional repressor LexA
MKDNPYYAFFYDLIYRQYRMTFNEFSVQYDMPSFGPIMYKLRTGKSNKVLPSTIKQVEQKLGIKIDDSDLNHIRYRTTNTDIHQSGTVKSIDAMGFHSFALIKRERVQEVILFLTQNAGRTVDHTQVDSLVQERIHLPYSSKNAVAGEVHTDMNTPMISPGDILLADFDAKVSDGNTVGVILKDGRYFVGKMTEYKTSAMFTFINAGKYAPIVVEKSEIAHISRIVQIIKNI